MAKNHHYEVVIVGGGHAGVEAALVCARRGFSTVLLTMRVDNIGALSCNPAIGGSAKGLAASRLRTSSGIQANGLTPFSVNTASPITPTFRVSPDPRFA